MKVINLYLPLSMPFRASLLTAAILAGCSSDNSVEVVMNRVTPDGIGPEIGTITLEEVSGGLQFTPNLYDLVPGEHGFHVHENPSCEPAEQDGNMVAALAAGGHYDPDNTGRHAGPDGDGHKGDLPVLMVDEKGFARSPVEARRLKLSEVKGRSLMIHAGGDNYSDNPPMGGGGARIACGVVK